MVTSFQNVEYHLSRLETVDHIESVDTWYSKKVIETDGYAPIYAPLMIG